MQILRKISKLFQKYPDRRLSMIDIERADNTERKTLKRDENCVLLQIIPNPCYFALFWQMAEDLKRDHVEVRFLVTRSIDAGLGKGLFSFVKRSSLTNYLFMRPWLRLLEADSETTHFVNRKLSVHSLKRTKQAFKIWREWVEVSRDTQYRRKLFYKEIQLDDLVIDTYLRFKPTARFKINDIFCLYIIWRSLVEIDELSEIFDSKKIQAYFTSYTSYTTHGLPVRVALSKKIKVVTFGDLGNFAAEININHRHHSINPDKLYADLKNISDEKMATFRVEARKTLEYRFSGGIDSAISYMANNAYNTEYNDNIHKTNLKNTTIVFLHDFYDSPNIYDDFIFNDFYDWTVQTVKLLKRYDKRFFIKEHPNQIDANRNVIESLKTKLGNVNWLDIKTDNKELIRGGCICGITAYGTVAGELAYFGIPSISCAKNPHYKFEFCKTASSYSDYEEMIRNITPFISKNDRRKYQEESLNYFVARNALFDQYAVEANDLYAHYWSLMHKPSNFERSQVKYYLGKLRSSDRYRKLIEGINDIV